MSFGVFKSGDKEILFLPNREFQEMKTFKDLYPTFKDYSTAKKFILGKGDKFGCKICGAEFLAANFRNEAHVLPQFLGKANLISKFECDNCNKEFSRLEESLANFTELERTMMAMPRKSRGRPKVKTTSGRSEITSEISLIENKKVREFAENLQKNGSKVIFIKEGADDPEFNLGESEIKFSNRSGPYVPYEIFRVLAKAAVVLMNPETLKSFSKLRAIVAGTNTRDFGDGLLHLNILTIPELRVVFAKPIIRLYISELNSENYFGGILVVYFGRQIWQLNLPSDLNLDYPRIKSVLIPKHEHPHLSVEYVRDGILLDLFNRAAYSTHKLGSREKCQPPPSHSQLYLGGPGELLIL